MEITIRDYQWAGTIATNATVYIDNVEVQNMGVVEVSLPFLVTVRANEGYWFDEAFEAGLLAREYGADYFIATFNFDSEYLNATKTELNYEVDTMGGTTLYFQGFNAVEGGAVIPPVDIVNKFAGLYNPTSEELTRLSNEKYREWEGTEPSSELTDLGRYISNLYVLPFSIDEVISEDKRIVRLGGVNLEVESYVLTASKLEIDVASFTVPLIYNNAYDYLNVSCRAFLPYMEPIELDVSRVLEKQIEVQYIIEFYTGSVTVNILSDGVLFETRQKEIKQEIPFKPSELDIAHSSAGAVVINNVKVPYIEIVRNIPYNEVEDVGRSFSQVEVIGNLAGYVEIEKVQLETSASKREQEMITSQLRNGVIIQ